MLSTWLQSLLAGALLCTPWVTSQAGPNLSEIRESRWDAGFHPGKLDLLLSHDEAQQYVNALFWSPVAKFGGGTLDAQAGLDQTFVGGYFRPLWVFPAYGDLVVGGMHVESQAGRQYELQAKYTAPCKLGFGCGLVQSELTEGDDYHFVRMEYERQIAGWTCKVAAVALDTLQHWTGGAYLAVYNERFMASAGMDGEEFRATLGFIQPERKLTPLRFAMEVAYADSDVGQFFAGGQSLLISGTLGYDGGFLGHPSRLGRAMGPTGVEFTNPLGFLRPTWNRRMETWELGTLMNWRAELALRDYRTARDSYECVVFPARPFASDALGRVFVGGTCRRVDDDEADWGFLGGYAGPIGPLRINVAVVQFFTTGETRVTAGAILPF